VSYHLDVIPNGILGVYLGTQFKLPDFFHFSSLGPHFTSISFSLGPSIFLCFYHRKKCSWGNLSFPNSMPICKVVLRLSSAVEKFYRHFSLLQNIFLCMQWKNCPSLCSYWQDFETCVAGMCVANYLLLELVSASARRSRTNVGFQGILISLI
jgi:hypothetical protein